MSQTFREITFESFKEAYPAAYDAMKVMCEDAGEAMAEQSGGDPWTPEGFRYFVLSPDDGTVVAEYRQRPGPREPGYIWSGAIAGEDARWFCSEDAEGPEVELGQRLSGLAPGGIGGWS